MSTSPHLPHNGRRWFAAGGEMARRIEMLAAPACPLGGVDDWPVALRNAMALILPADAEIVLFWGADYIALYNDAYAPTIGLKHPRALGRPAREGWSELWSDLEPLLHGVRETGETFSAKDRPFYLERQGFGETAYFDISYSAVPDDDGSVGGVLCIVSDTTERVRAARVVAEDRARLAQMFDQAPSFIAVLRQPGHVYELVNASYLQLVGHRDLIGKTVREAMPELAGQGYYELLDRVAADGVLHRDIGAKVAIQRTPDGAAEDRFIDVVFQPVTDKDGVVAAIFVEGNDVTDRHQAEERLMLSEESLRLATVSAEIGTWDVDLVSDTLDWSERTKAMFGFPPDAVCTMADFYAGLHPDDFAATTATFQSALDPDRRALYDVEYRTIGATDQVVRWIAARGRGIFDADGTCIRAIGTTIDITDRKRAEAELRESESRFRQLADSAPALIWVTDETGAVVFANQAFETMLGVSTATMLDTGWRSIIAPVSAPHFNRTVFLSRKPASGDVAVRTSVGDTRWMHVEARPRLLEDTFLGYIGCAVDVTDAHRAAEALERGIAARTAELARSNQALTRQIEERERVEATLHQMQRLEAVGQLTSGVAHDFNNLLTVVLGNVGMIDRAARAAGLDDRTLTRLGHVRAAAERGAALTAQLLAFSRRQRLEAKTIDLNVTVAGMQELLRSSLGNAITIDTRLADRLWPALVDPTQIELIILNLAINARDAMAVGGTVTVETANASLGEPAGPEEPPAGDHVMVAVSDTGTGMTPAVRAKAFEPFFTTKEVGRGSGLGLAQVFGFAKQSGGGVRIETAEGRGTRVCVYVPRSTVVPAASAAGHRDDGEAGSIAATILIVDDEDPVRAVTADTLAGFGATVLEASSGAAAIELVAARTDIDLVVADFAMPGMNGAELAARLAVLRPGVPVLMLTGYADRGAIAEVAEDAIVQKPFRPADLCRRIVEMLAP